MNIFVSFISYFRLLVDSYKRPKYKLSIFFSCLLLHFLSRLYFFKQGCFKTHKFINCPPLIAMHLPASLSTSSFGGLYRLKANETTAAISKMISVMSCRASHTNSRKVLGGFGGIMLDPNTSRRPSKSALSPRRPVIGQIC